MKTKNNKKQNSKKLYNKKQLLIKTDKQKKIMRGLTIGLSAVALTSIITPVIVTAIRNPLAPLPEDRKADPTYFEITTEGEITGWSKNKSDAQIKKYCSDGIIRLPAAKSISSDAFNIQFRAQPFGTEIRIDASTESIGDRAFYGNTATTVSFTEGEVKLSTIGESCFAFCENLASFKFPSSMLTATATVGKGAFSNCTSLSKIDLTNFDGNENTFTNWGEESFTNTAAEGTVLFTGSESSTNQEALARAWTRLVYFGIAPAWNETWNTSGEPQWATQIKAVPIEYFNIENGEFTGLKSQLLWPLADANFNEVKADSTVTSIGANFKANLISGRASAIKWNFKNAGTSFTSVPESAFSSCGVTGSTVILPSTVTTLGASAFESWNGTVELNSSALTSIGEKALKSTVYKNSQATTTDEYGKFVVSSTLATNATAVGNNAFESNTGITYIDMTALTEKPAWTATNIFASTGGTPTTTQYIVKIKDLSSDYNKVDQWRLRSSFKDYLNTKGMTIVDGSETGTPTWSLETKTTFALNELFNVSGNSIIGWAKNKNGTQTELSKTEVAKIFAENSLGDTLTIPSTIDSTEITSVADDAFTSKLPDCVTKITFSGDKCTSVGANAFKGNTNVKEVTIPATVTSIGNSAFEGLTGLTKLDLSAWSTAPEWTGTDIFKNVGTIPPATGTTLQVVNKDIKGTATDKEVDQWLLNYPLKNKLSTLGITIKTSSTEGWVFSTTESANVLKIESNVVTGWSTTSDGTGLTDDQKNNLSKDKNGGIENTVVIPATVTSVAANAFNPTASGKSETINAVFPSTLTTIQFAENSACTTIGEGAFFKNTNITTFNASNAANLESISAKAFFECTGLTSVTFNNVTTNTKFTTVGDHSFTATSLSTIVLPKSTTSIGKGAFWDCDVMTSVDLSNIAWDNTVSFGDGAFGNCDTLATITLGAHTAAPAWTMGSGVFDGCAKGTSASKCQITVSVDVTDEQKAAILTFFQNNSMTIILGQWEVVKI